MDIKTASFVLALLIALLPILSPAALAGVGCGSNWMGDTSGDTDFYVSKNQNQASTGLSSNAATTSTAAAVPLGSKVSANKNATITSLKADIESPQLPGNVVVWTAEASNPGNEKMQYDFQLNGPSTGGELKDMTGWIDDNTWIWNTTDADIGESEIVVYVARLESAESEDSRTETYAIKSDQKSDATVDLDITPSAKTSVASTNSSSSVSSSTSSSNADSHQVLETASENSDKPRTAPDERTSEVTSISGPNMQMPDPSPKSLTETAIQETTEVKSVEVEPATLEVMEAEGKWTIKLEDAGTTLNPLTLIQTDDSVMGMGTYNDGNTKLQVSAKGSVGSNSMSLEAWTIISEYGNKIDKHVELELVKVDRVISGSYELYSGEDLIGKGNVTASKFSS
jgi:hypothetical protein